MITLHESNITSFPLDNGIGVLSDAIKAYAEEELNGLFEFYMEYDSEGFLVDELKEERIIKAKAQDKLGYQLFRIYSITKSHENDNLIIKGQHITYDLANNFVEELIASSMTKKQVMEQISSNAVDPHPFNITSTNNTTRSSTKLYRTNPLQMVAGMDGSVLQIWGGQIERDNFHLILHDRRGSDDGVKVTYEKNITGLTGEVSISGLVTRIFPFVYIEATDDTPERLITVSGKYINSPLIKEYSQFYTEPIDYSHDDRIDIQDKTDAEIRAQLTSVAIEYFNETGNDKPKAVLDVSFEHLWETEEYKDVKVLELVGMGDTVTVEHSKLKVDATSIVNYIRYDCIAHVNEEVKLGNVKARFSDSINKIDRIEQKVEEAESNANQAIISANGKNTTYYGPDEPTGDLKVGDLWFRIVDGEYTRTYRFDGIEWQLIIDMDSQEAKADAQQARNRADEAYDNANLATQNAVDAINIAQDSFDKAQDAITQASGADSKANQAITKAQEGFDKAQESLDGLTTLTEFVDDNTGEIATIKGSVQGLQASVSDLDGNVVSLQMTSQSLSNRLSDAEGNLTTISATVQGLQTQVSDVEGNVSTVTQLATSLERRMTDSEGNINTLQSTASSLTSKIENIGGRNLIRNSRGDSLDGWRAWGANDTSISNYLGHDWIWVRRTTDNQVGIHTPTFDLKANEKYTISFLIRSRSNSGYQLNYLYLRQGTSSLTSIKRLPSVNMADPKFKGDIAGDGLRVWFTFEHDEDIEDARILIAISDRPENAGFVIRELQVEQSEVVNDWSPAPEDNENKFSAINQTIDSIATRVQATENDYSSLSQTVQGFQTTVSNMQGDLTSVTQLANTHQTKISNLQGDVSTLTQTATSMQSTLQNKVSENLFVVDDLELVIFFWVGIINLPKGTESLYIKAHGDVPNSFNVVYNFVDSSGGATSNVTLDNVKGGQKINVPPNVVSMNIIIESDIVGIEITREDIANMKMKVEVGDTPSAYSPAGEDTAFQSQISQLSSAINLRVQKGDVINQINVDTSGILIGGKKLILDGDTTVLGTFKIDGSAHIKDASIGNAQIGHISAAKINSGELNTNLLTVFGGTSTSYTRIQGSLFESRGQFTKTWFGKTETHDVRLRFAGGQLRAESLTDDRRLYYSHDGISTYYQGSNEDDGGLAGSGVIEFFSHMYSSEARGLTLYSNRGVVALKTGTRDIILDSDRGVEIIGNRNYISLYPNRENRGGENEFRFYIKQGSDAYVDGTLTYGRHDTGRGSGIRFSKDTSNRDIVYATNNSGDYYTGQFAADWFRGKYTARTGTTYITMGIEDRVRITDRSGYTTTNGTVYKDLQLAQIQAYTLRINTGGSRTFNNFFIGVSTGELRVVTNNTIVNNDFSNAVYRPVRASAFNESSSREYKTDIATYEGSALDVINNLTVVNFRLKDDIANGVDDLRIGFIAEDSEPIASKDLKAIQSYKVGAYNTKAIQELHEEFNLTREELVLEIAQLKLELMETKQKIRELESVA